MNEISDVSSSDVDSNSANYYDRNFQTYLKNNQNPSDFIDEFLELLRHSHKENAERKIILDLGCGPGTNSEYMHSNNFRVVGIDLSPNMIEHARRTCPHIEFLVGDMRDLSFPLDSFDGIFASYSLIHLSKEEIPHLLAKLHKILKPGGIIYLSVQSGESSQGFYSHPLTPNDPVFLNIFSKEEILSLLTKYGFEIISQHEKLPRGKVFNFTKFFTIARKLS